jgi:nucleotide-binding universal stress UspA family protein
MTRILIPLDGSEFSVQVLESIKKFFAPNACRLVLYRVGAPTEGFTGLPPRPAASEMPLPMYETGQDVELAHHPIYESQEDDSRLSALSDQLESLAQLLRAQGYTVNVQVDLGNAAEAIIERARAEDIDLIAMTTHGRSGISRLLFGSVAEQIVRHVSVPVLLLRPSHTTSEA